MGPLRLTLLRHGQAQAGDSCPEDFERALTRRGTAEVREMASRLQSRQLIPDLILVSPAERTWATAAIVADTCELDRKQLQGIRELYLAAPQTIWQLLTRQKWHARHVLICGHNPGLSLIASSFGPMPRSADLPPAGCVTAIWHQATWTTIEPETANACEWDEPV